MLKNNKELFLSFLGVAAFKVHMWNLKRKSKQLLEKKQENHAEYTHDDIIEHLNSLSEIQAGSDLIYFLLILMIALLFF
ncbi:hypothetical protein [Clostridium tetani]|uniref:hypothetical protein n=1 Tax=Clostridium tetani TaxID=1513 RepID=UPI000512D48B|nr:hypothetical protein [Clostridium tetani]AVP56068.1 hypothetical protein C3B72_13465 [Clostridium tetani]KGI43016.1 hypothetical protein KY55_08245 [Clostridium tetani]RXI67454.1 hypothetical protein DP127_14250 [Clostridium tetani]RXI78863.1 hypothetical protein DP128_00395 [Clostridium tetani]RXM56713.1 hypothetical protein DP133_13390 [Clostridium tetani]